MYTPEETKIFNALGDEADFAKSILASGATDIRNISYADIGKYFLAFTSLSTGLERIGKLCFILDYFLNNNGSFPDHNYMQKKIGHNLEKLYKKALEIKQSRSYTFNYLQDLESPVHKNILGILKGFAMGDRYSNIDKLVGSLRESQPAFAWYDKVDLLIFDTHISEEKQNKIFMNAKMANEMLGGISITMFSLEDGSLTYDMEETSRRSGIQSAVAPYRQLYVYQMIRFWVELLNCLHRDIRRSSDVLIPSFLEMFSIFYCDDAYAKTKKRWDNC